MTSEETWFEDYADDVEPESSIAEYELTSSPSDFNTLTLFNYVESGAIYIPNFQRNYVWDIKKASKLIESLIIGLPVPQLFLYEEEKNRLLVIDGQQRLMSLYYFFKQRFPLMEKRAELRRVFEEYRSIPDHLLNDDKYFQDFALRLPARLENQPNKFDGLKYKTLGEAKTQFELRGLRNIIVKQVSPSDDDDSSMYEIFNRLNSGGINLTPQEIRSSLYHSKFYAALFSLNLKDRWRELLGIGDPDLHAKDVEFILRSFALLVDSAQYRPSMSKFLNRFSKRAKQYDDKLVQYCEALFDSFLKACARLDSKTFRTNNRFSITIFESVFCAAAEGPLKTHSLIEGAILPESIATLRADTEFLSAVERATTDSTNVEKRLKQARKIIKVTT